MALKIMMLGPSNIGPGQKGSGTVDNEDRGAVGGYLYFFNGLGSSTFEKHFISKMSGTSGTLLVITLLKHMKNLVIFKQPQQ